MPPTPRTKLKTKPDKIVESESENDEDPKTSVFNHPVNFIEINYGAWRQVPINHSSCVVHLQKYFCQKLREHYEEDFLDYATAAVNQSFLEMSSHGGDGRRARRDRSPRMVAKGATREERQRNEVKENNLAAAIETFLTSRSEQFEQLQQAENGLETEDAAHESISTLKRRNSQFTNLSISDANNFIKILQGIKYEKKTDKNSRGYKLYNNKDDPEDLDDDRNHWIESFDLIDRMGAPIGLYSYSNSEHSGVSNISKHCNLNFTRQNNKFILCSVHHNIITGEIKEIVPLLLDPPLDVHECTSDWLKLFTKRKLRGMKEQQILNAKVETKESTLSAQQNVDRRGTVLLGKAKKEKK